MLIINSILYLIENPLEVATLVISIIALLKTCQYNKKEKEDRELDLTANLYSYPVIYNKNQCQITVYMDKQLSVPLYNDDYNILISDNKNNIDDNYFKNNMLEIELYFKNRSKIFPSNILIKDLTIIYNHETYKKQDILTNPIFLHPLNNEYKKININENDIINFKVFCILDKKVIENINNSLSTDEIIQIHFKYSFKNIFNVYTEGAYSTVIQKTKQEKNESSNIIDSNKKIYKYKTNKSQLTIDNIYYKNIER